MAEHPLCWLTASRLRAFAIRESHTHHFWQVMISTAVTSLLHYPTDSACHHLVLQEIHQQDWIIVLAFVIVWNIKNLK